MSSPVIEDLIEKLRELQASMPTTVPPASSTALGAVKLRGDLAGSAESPTVPGLATKADLVGGKVPASQLPPGSGGGGASSWDDLSGKPIAFPPAQHTHTTADVPGLDGRLASKADLVDDGTGRPVVPTSQIPAIATTSTIIVATAVERLALTAAQVQSDDRVVQTGDPGRGTYFLTGSDRSSPSSWTLSVAPTDAVSSVNGQSGVVVLGRGDVGLGQVDNTPDASKPVSTAQAAAIAGRAPLEHAHSIGDLSDMTEAGQFVATAVDNKAIRNYIGALSAGAHTDAEWKAGVDTKQYGISPATLAEVLGGPGKLQVGPDGPLAATLLTRTNGAGKTELLVQFATGSPIVIATQP